MPGRGAPGVTATCGRRCPGSSGVVAQPVWSLCTGTQLPKEVAGWGWGLTGYRIALLGFGQVRRAHAAGCSPASELRLLRSKITAQKPGLPFAPSPLPLPPPPAAPCDTARVAMRGTLRGSRDPHRGLGVWVSPTCLECEAEDEMVMLENQHLRLIAFSPFPQLPSLSFLSF